MLTCFTRPSYFQEVLPIGGLTTAARHGRSSTCLYLLHSLGDHYPSTPTLKNMVTFCTRVPRVTSLEDGARDVTMKYAAVTHILVVMSNLLCRRTTLRMASAAMRSCCFSTLLVVSSRTVARISSTKLTRTSSTVSLTTRPQHPGDIHSPQAASSLLPTSLRRTRKSKT